MRETLLMSIGLVILGLCYSCAGTGAAKSASDGPAAISLETSMYDEGSQEQRMKESEAERSHINVNTQARSAQQKRTGPPENVIYPDGQYNPAPGYTLIIPDDQKDLRVKKKEIKEYWKIDTSSDIYIDNNLILGDTISHETKSIYSVLLQDASISIRSGENARRLYVEELKKIDLQLSPPEFQDAFEKHINAWERDSTDEINSTMDEILRIALKYGVRMKK